MCRTHRHPPGTLAVQQCPRKGQVCGPDCKALRVGEVRQRGCHVGFTSDAVRDVQSCSRVCRTVYNVEFVGERGERHRFYASRRGQGAQQQQATQEMGLCPNPEPSADPSTGR